MSILNNNSDNKLTTQSSLKNNKSVYKLDRFSSIDSSKLQGKKHSRVVVDAMKNQHQSYSSLRQKSLREYEDGDITASDQNSNSIKIVSRI